MTTAMTSVEDAGAVAAQVESDAEELESFGVKDVPWASIISGISTKGFQDTVKEDLKRILKNQELILGALQQIETEIKWTALVEEVTPSVTGIESLWNQMKELGADHDPPWSQETLDAEKARWIKGVLDDDTGVTPALTLIANVANGTVPLSDTSKGLIETFFDKVNDHEKHKKEKAVYLNVYHHCRAYLGQLFMIQFMGTVMLVNAYLAQGEKGPAQTVVSALRANMKAQTDLMSHVTPHLLKALVHLPGKGHSFKARFRDCKEGKVIYAARVGIVGLRHKENTLKERWGVEPVDHDKTEYYIWSVEHGPGGKIRGGEQFAGEDHPLRCGGEDSHPIKWRFVPSSGGDGYFLIVRANGKGMRAVGATAFLSEEFRDKKDTQWKPEIEHDAPTVFP